MKKVRADNVHVNINMILSFILIFVFILGTTLFTVFIRRGRHYSFFIEFKSAYGISKGTPIRLRGMNIGYINSIRIQSNSILTLANINSNRICIPKDSIIETNQTGLLNETVIDIIPLVSVYNTAGLKVDPLSKTCSSHNIICQSMYIEGDRGLNYDDLIRATTRISQRFDDPRFFNILYIFLQNMIEISDNFLEFIVSLSDLTSIIYLFLLYSSS